MLPCLLSCPLSDPSLSCLSCMRLSILGLAVLFFFSPVSPHLTFFSLCAPLSFSSHGRTVKPLYSEQSRDPKKCSLYGGVHPRGVRYVHAHMCLNYNVQILKLFCPCLRDSSGGRAIFHKFHLYFMIYFLCWCTIHISHSQPFFVHPFIQTD